MTPERPKVGLAVFIVKDDKILLYNRPSKNAGGTWGTPGGHLEFGETWEECAKRETMEEAGIELKNVRFWTVTNDIFDGKHYITLFMLAEYNYGKMMEMWDWYTWDNLPRPLFPSIENLIKQNLNPVVAFHSEK